MAEEGQTMYRRSRLPGSKNYNDINTKVIIITNINRSEICSCTGTTRTAVRVNILQPGIRYYSYRTCTCTDYSGNNLQFTARYKKKKIIIMGLKNKIFF